MAHLNDPRQAPKTSVPPPLDPIWIKRSIFVDGFLATRRNRSDVAFEAGDELLARRWVRYAYAYPFCEALAGILMAAGALNWVLILVALFIGTVGVVSVFKAVYVDKREIKCACVSGAANVPLGFVSLTENLMMVGMALWMLVRP